MEGGRFRGRSAPAGKHRTDKKKERCVNMKRKLLSLALALGLVLTLLPATAAAAGETCPGGSSCDHFFEAGGLHFTDLEEAIGAAGAGGTIKLLDDIFSRFCVGK